MGKKQRGGASKLGEGCTMHDSPPYNSYLLKLLMKHNTRAKIEIVYNQESTTLVGGRGHLGMCGSVSDRCDNFRASFTGLTSTMQGMVP